MSLSTYEWPRPHGFEPFDHQKKTAEFLAKQRKAFCFSQAGTGKTASVIWASDYLMELGLVRRVLVICPLSIMKAAWQADLFKFALHRSVDVAYGSADKRRDIIRRGADYVIINFDGVEIVKDEIAQGGFDLIVVDEASAYKNSQAKRWKTLSALSKNIRGLWMLTGTPAAQSPLDAYGLAKLVNPKNSPRFFGEFRDKTMVKVSQYRYVPRPTAIRYVHEILQPAIRFEKKDCLDLPPVLHTFRDAPLSPQQVKYYKDLKKQALVAAAGEEISAVNAAVLATKLLQIACGSVYSDTGSVIDFDVSNRLSVVQEIIDEASHKVLVFVPFTHTIDLLRDYLVRNGTTCEVINGDVAVGRRSDIVKDFQETDRIRVLIIQPQAAAHGLTLTAADTIIWYAPCTSVETYLQANARIDRPGQKHNMTIVHIKGSPIEEKLYGMLQGNITNHQQVTEMYRKEILDSDT